MLATLPTNPNTARPQALPAAAFYQEFQPLIRRLIRQYADDAEMRQDLEGEIYCRFCRILEAYDPSRGIPLKPYLIRMLTAAVYTYTRSHRRSRSREVPFALATPDGEAPVSADPTPGWDQGLMSRDVLAALPDAIAKLPARQRQVVVWRYYESRSFEEIAESLDIRPATARSLLRYGLQNLRRQVAGLLPED